MPEIPDMMGAMRDMDDRLRKRNNPAGYMLERVRAQLTIFQKKMPDEAEVGLLVVGNTGVFHLRSITVSNPDILIFNGVDQDGRSMQLLQHHSQMSVMFVEVPKLAEEPYRIGFT